MTADEEEQENFEALRDFLAKDGIDINDIRWALASRTPEELWNEGGFAEAITPDWDWSEADAARMKEITINAFRYMKRMTQ